jgi:undecaprenyl-diphosphatase
MKPDVRGRHAHRPMRRTWPAIVATLAVALLFFLVIALLVTTRPLLVEPIEAAAFDWLRGNGSAPPWFAEAVRDVSSLGSLSVLIGTSLLTAAYLLLIGQPRAALHIAIAAAGGVALGMGLKIPFDRARPDLLLHATQVFTRSFPSAHGTVSAAVLFTLAALIARHRGRISERVFILAAAAGIILLIGASRIYLGVHWPSDVVAGWALGTAWACACWLMMGDRGRPPHAGTAREIPPRS